MPPERFEGDATRGLLILILNMKMKYERLRSYASSKALTRYSRSI